MIWHAPLPPLPHSGRFALGGVNENEVDVRREIELAPAQLSHAEHGKPGGAVALRARFAPACGQIRPDEIQCGLHDGFGKIGELAREFFDAGAAKNVAQAHAQQLMAAPAADLAPAVAILSNQERPLLGHVDQAPGHLLAPEAQAHPVADPGPERQPGRTDRGEAPGPPARQQTVEGPEIALQHVQRAYRREPFVAQRGRGIGRSARRARDVEARADHHPGDALPGAGRALQQQASDLGAADQVAPGERREPNMEQQMVIVVAIRGEDRQRQPGKLRREATPPRGPQERAVADVEVAVDGS